MMNIHQLIDATANFTFTTSPVSDFLFDSCPVILIGLWTITTHPTWMIFTVKPVLSPPQSRASMRTKIMAFCFKISNGASKFFFTPFTQFCSSVLWPFSSCWTFVIARLGTIFSLIANKINKRFITNWTYFFNSPVVILPPTNLISFFIFPIHNPNITTDMEIVKDYYKDYYEAALDRFNRHKQQTVLEFTYND